MSGRRRRRREPLVRTLWAALAMSWRAHRAAFVTQLALMVVTGLAPVAAGWLLRAVLDALTAGPAADRPERPLGAGGGARGGRRDHRGVALPGAVPDRAVGQGHRTDGGNGAVRGGQPAGRPAPARGPGLPRPAQHGPAGRHVRPWAGVHQRHRHGPGRADPVRLPGLPAGAQPGARGGRAGGRDSGGPGGGEPRAPPRADDGGHQPRRTPPVFLRQPAVQPGGGQGDPAVRARLVLPAADAG